MKVSQKADYAMRAMLDLARRGREDRPLRSSDIAARAGVPEKFLEAILVDLRKAGLVRSRRGPEGGHLLAKPAARINAAEIREAIDGPLSLAAERRGRSESPEDQALRQLWGDLEKSIHEALSRTSLEDLVRRVEAQTPVADFSI